MSPRPNFKLPFPAGTVVSIQTYRGHNPDDKKMDMYAQNWPHDSAVVAAAAGLVHEHFDPGGIEINHGGGWFTTYMHMAERAPVGRRVEQGQWVGKAGSVGTGAKHLHHEQLYAGKGATDADTGDMVNPVIQGKGPMVLVPGHPIRMTSTNSRASAPAPSAPSKPGRKSVNQLAREVIAGKWGNGPARRIRLTAKGYSYKRVQAEVNRLLGS